MLGMFDAEAWSSNRIIAAVFVIPVILLIFTILYKNLRDKGDK